MPYSAARGERKLSSSSALMAFVGHAPQQVLVSLDLPADHEKGGFGVSLQQAIQHRTPHPLPNLRHTQTAHLLTGTIAPFQKHLLTHYPHIYGYATKLVHSADKKD